MENVYDELKSLIDYIQSAYTEITNEWVIGNHSKVSLKKSQVADIDTDGTLYRNIIEYVQLLNSRSAGITLQLSTICFCPVTARVKTQNSIEYKIQSYKTARHEAGKVPIIKCINDLFGIRVVIEPPLAFAKIQTFLHQYYPGKYRCIDSSKGDYKAVHLYFRADNFSFPWELQIWNKCDVEANFISHKNYKQAYTTWEKESKEGGIING